MAGASEVDGLVGVPEGDTDDTADDRMTENETPATTERPSVSENSM